MATACKLQATTTTATTKEQKLLLICSTAASRCPDSRQELLIPFHPKSKVVATSWGMFPFFSFNFNLLGFCARPFCFLLVVLSCASIRCTLRYFLHMLKLPLRLLVCVCACFILFVAQNWVLVEFVANDFCCCRYACINFNLILQHNAQKNYNNNNNLGLGCAQIGKSPNNNKKVQVKRKLVLFQHRDCAVQMLHVFLSYKIWMFEVSKIISKRNKLFYEHYLLFS